MTIAYWELIDPRRIWKEADNHQGVSSVHVVCWVPQAAESPGKKEKNQAPGSGFQVAMLVGMKRFVNRMVNLIVGG